MWDSNAPTFFGHEDEAQMTSRCRSADKSQVCDDFDAAGETPAPPEHASNDQKRREMNEIFCRRLRAAIQAGMEFCKIGVSTAACTRFPVSNYRRPDH